MKKGLRPLRLVLTARPGRFQTADLMKKGLRLTENLRIAAHPLPNRRPDEEGIKTGVADLGVAVDDVPNRRPDEEGIKTTSSWRR